MFVMLGLDAVCINDKSTPAKQLPEKCCVFDPSFFGLLLAGCVVHMQAEAGPERVMFHTHAGASSSNAELLLEHTIVGACHACCSQCLTPEHTFYFQVTVRLLTIQ